MSSTVAYSTATPTVAQRNRDQVAVMLAAGRRADERAARARKIDRLAAAYVGHATAVEADTDFGRFWSTFPGTEQGARAAAEYILLLSDRRELSDIDCTTQCPCTRERYPELFDA